MDNKFLRSGWRACVAAALLAVGGCSSTVRQGMVDGWDHAGYASPCGAAFIGYHGRIERCMDE